MVVWSRLRTFVSEGRAREGHPVWRLAQGGTRQRACGSAPGCCSFLWHLASGGLGATPASAMGSATRWLLSGSHLEGGNDASCLCSCVLPARSPLARWWRAGWLASPPVVSPLQTKGCVKRRTAQTPETGRCPWRGWRPPWVVPSPPPARPGRSLTWGQRETREQGSRAKAAER